MKFLFVIDNLGSGGAQRQLVMLACALRRKGIEIDFFIYFPKNNFFQKELESMGINVSTSYKKNRYSLRPTFALRRLIINNNYTSILSFLNTANFYSELATILSFNKTPLYVSERSCYRNEDKLTLMTIIRERFHKVAQLVICNSYYQRDQVLNRYSWLDNRVITILNGVDTDKFKPIVPIQKNKKLLVVARVDKGKNALNLAKALRFFKATEGWCPTITWVGKEDITPESKIYIKSVKQYLAQNDLEKYWHWKGECKDIPKIMSEHNGLIHPSLFEGFPNAVCEAVSSGLPVLISDVNDNKILVDNNKNGFLFNPNNIEDISNVLLKFFKLSDDEIDTIGRNCRQFAEENLSIEKYASLYLDVLTKQPKI